MLIYYYVAINIITFAIWGIDKFKAEKHLWRISERTLLALMGFGGSFGALAGMSLFRHKTRKLYFWVLGVICSVIHAIIIAFLFIS